MATLSLAKNLISNLSKSFPHSQVSLVSLRPSLKNSRVCFTGSASKFSVRQNAAAEERDSNFHRAYADKDWREKKRGYGSADVSKHAKETMEEGLERAKDYTYEAKKKAKTMAEKAKEGTYNAKENAKDYAYDAKEKTKDMAGNVAEKAKEGRHKMAESADSAKEKAEGVVETVVDKVKGGTHKAAETVKDTVKGAWEATKETGHWASRSRRRCWGLSSAWRTCPRMKMRSWLMFQTTRPRR